MTTPIDPTPLDALKQTVLRTENLIGMVQDMLGQHRVDDPNAPSVEIEQEILDSVRMELWTALGSVMPGVGWDRSREAYTLSPEAREAHRTYSDGTPVYVVIELGPGRSVDYYPRLDGDVGEFVRLIRDDDIARSIAEPHSDQAEGQL